MYNVTKCVICQNDCFDRSNLLREVVIREIVSCCLTCARKVLAVDSPYNSDIYKYKTNPLDGDGFPTDGTWPSSIDKVRKEYQAFHVGDQYKSENSQYSLEIVAVYDNLFTWRWTHPTASHQTWIDTPGDPNHGKLTYYIINYAMKKSNWSTPDKVVEVVETAKQKVIRLEAELNKAKVELAQDELKPRLTEAIAGLTLQQIRSLHEMLAIEIKEQSKKA